MGQFSDDEDVNAAVEAAEADYQAALDALDPESEESTAAYKSARDAFFNARQTARAGRGMSMNME